MASFRDVNRPTKPVVDGVQLPESGQNVKNPLEMYLIEKRPSGQITTEELEEYKQLQRDQIDDMKAKFGLLKHNQKIEPSIFILAKIEHVVSPRDFYAVQVCHLAARIEFQNILNHAYEQECEPINKLKAKDLCIMLHNSNWCRAEVIEIVTERIGKVRAIVYLLDYGVGIRTKKKHLYMMKTPHNLIKPFAIKCQLSIMNKDEEEELKDHTKFALSKVFENISQRTNQFLLYLEHDHLDIYNVMLFTDIETDLNTVYGAYLIHEFYGAFVQPNVKFDNEVCEEWSNKILQMVNICDNYRTNKMEVYISHVVSPVEIYIRCKAAQELMFKIRRIIDENVYVDSNTARCDYNWSIGDDCLVELQNWNTACNLKQWYRGRITDQMENVYTVFLRDYGRKVVVNRTDLMTISSKLAAPADAVQKCCLQISNSWTESSNGLLGGIVDQYTYFAISNVSRRDSNLFVTLWATNCQPMQKKTIDTVQIWDEIWDNIGLRIVSQLITQSMEPFIKRSQRCYDKIQLRKYGNCWPDDDISDYCDELEMLEKLNLKDDLYDDVKPEELIYSDEDYAENFQILVPEWLPPIPLERSVFNGIVTYITSQGIIYLQEESDHEIAYGLGKSITEHLRHVDHLQGTKYIWHEGEPCFAAFHSGSYHRAVIKKINRENAICVINYIDYGDNAEVKLDDLCQATGFGEIPILAHKFYVSRLVPADKTGKWCKKVLTEFRLRLQNEMCIVSIDNVARGEPKDNQILPCSIEPLILPDMSSCDMYKWLLKKNLGYNTGVNDSGQEILIV